MRFAQFFHKTKETPGTAPLLIDRRPIPETSPEQLQHSTYESLHAKPVGRFNPVEGLRVLRESEGKRVIGIDLGGGKATIIPFTVNEGKLVADQEKQITVPNNGDAGEYLPLFETVGKYAEENGIPVGISCAGVVEGTKLVESPNMPSFTMNFQNKYESDFARIFPTATAINNDAQAAIQAAALDAARQGLLPEGEGKIISMEPGHVELNNLQRPQEQQIPDEPCGMFGQEFVCVERTIGGAAGIESRWAKTTGEHLDAKKISELYQQGNILAAQLFDTSAKELATGIQGMANVNGLTGEQTKAGLVLPIVGGGFGGAAIVMDAPQPEMQFLNVTFHGGINNVPGYMERVAQILEQSGTKITSSFTDTFSINAGAEGAALAALMTASKQEN